MDVSILILSGRVDKWCFLRHWWPVITPGVHNPDRLSQLAENRFAKAQEGISAPPQQQAMFAPNHHACSGHEDPMPEVNQPDQKCRPVPPQNRQTLALKINVFDFILQDLIAKPANRWRSRGLAHGYV